MSDNENNYIEEVYAIANKPVVEPEPITSTELKVKVSKMIKHHHYYSDSLILVPLVPKWQHLPYRKSTIPSNQFNVQVRGRYSSVTATKMATFKVQLPDFCNSKTITLRAYVDDDPVGVHDIILGTRVFQQLGLIFDFLSIVLSTGMNYQWS
jgi:hypothetical protein